MRDALTLRELADYLQMSVDSVYHLVRRGKIPGVKVGKQWRFSRAAIDRWLGCRAARTVRVVIAAGADAQGLIREALQSESHQTIVVETAEQLRQILAEFGT